MRILNNLKLGLAGIVLAGGLNGCDNKNIQKYTQQNQQDYKNNHQMTIKKDSGNDSLNPLNIEYLDFEKMPFDSNTRIKYNLNERIKSQIDFMNESEIIIRDKKDFEKQVFDEALKLNYTKEKIFKTKSKEIIKLAVDIVSKKINYWDVDNVASLNVMPGRLGSFFLDDLFLVGLGDCDKYSKLTTAIFDIFKGINANLKNIYLTQGGTMGAEPIAHSWNQIILVSNDSIYVSHIDPTFYDRNREELQAKRGEHIAKEKLEFLCKFYEDISDYKTAIKISKALLQQTEDKEKRANFYSELSYLSYATSDKEMMDFTKKFFYAEGLDKYQDQKESIEENELDLIINLRNDKQNENTK